MRAGCRPAALPVVAVLLTLLASSAPPAVAQSEQDVPVAGTFAYRSGNTDAEAEVRGAVHAVRRVPGGTAVYYSLGVAEGESLNGVRTMPVISLSEGYDAGDAFAVRLLDPVGLQLYLPMTAADACLCSEVYDFGSTAGQLNVGWAVLPPLPPEVTEVSVLIGYGSVESVPVEDGPLLPTADTVPLSLGAGWPALPDATAVTDPAAFSRTLVRRTADRERTVTTSESTGRVDEALSADVLFASGSATLSPAARGTLQQVGARLQARAQGKATVVGHTDSVGQTAANQTLSEARARAVRDALAPQVGTAVQLVASGRGESEPVADDTTPEGRQANRRVTVTYTVKPGA